MPPCTEARTAAGAVAEVTGNFGIVVSSYNSTITDKLLSGAMETLLASGLNEQSIRVVRVPGAWEIPLAARTLANMNGIVAVITLGAVIRGETSHDQHINRAVSLALMNMMVETQKPIAFGVLTCNSLEQAIHRSGGNVGNKGCEAAQAVLEMVRLLADLKRNK